LTTPRNNDIAEIKKTVEHIEQVVITGNGEPSLRETVRANASWIKANLELPNDVQAHSRWIGNLNRVAWIIITVLMGIFIEFGCMATLGVVLLLNQSGLLKP